MNTAYLVSRVRMKLQILDVSVLPEQMIYDVATEVQNSILQRIRPEVTFSIQLVAGQEAYAFPDPTTISISSILPSWPGDITLVSFSTWQQVRINASGSAGYPVQAAIWGGQLYVSPVPSSASIAGTVFPNVPSGSITFAAHQTSAMVQIDATHNPSMSSQFDRLLIYGVVAELDPKQLVLFENEMKNVQMLPFLKSDLTIMEATW